MWYLSLIVCLFYFLNSVHLLLEPFSQHPLLVWTNILTLTSPRAYLQQLLPTTALVPPFLL